MHRPLRLLLALLLLAPLSACDPAKTVEKFASDADKTRAIGYIEMMRAGKIAELEPHVAPSLKTPDLVEVLQKMAHVMPAGEPTKRTLIGAYVNYANGVRSSNLTYQYGFGDRWFMVNCAYIESGPDKGIFGMQIEPLSAELKAQPEFSLRGKTPVQYGVLAGAIVAVVLTITALILCVCERGLRRKWVWVVCMLLGVLQLRVDWATGAWDFHTFHFLLFSASAVFQPYGSWVVAAAVPVGALVYLARRFWNHPPPPLSKPETVISERYS